jgi:hypothetical protein
MPYIRSIRVAAPGTHNEHITAVRHSISIGGALQEESVTSVASRIIGGASYRSHNDRTGAEATVVARTSAAGRRYIATVANGRESDNLLSLPRF